MYDKTQFINDYKHFITMDIIGKYYYYKINYEVVIKEIPEPLKEYKIPTNEELLEKIKRMHKEKEEREKIQNIK